MKGYVYILSNPCMKDDQLKIGRTTRTPEKRAKEISKGTGVPMPFEVAHSREFDNCIEAERTIHETLKEHRVNTDREFFQIPLFKAIKEIDDLAFAELKAKLIIVQKGNLSKSNNLFEEFKDANNSEQMEIVFYTNLKREVLDEEESWGSFLKYINLLSIFESNISNPPDHIYEKYDYEEYCGDEFRYKDWTILFTQKKMEVKDDLIKNKLSSLINQLRKKREFYNEDNLINGFIANYLIVNSNFAYFFDFKSLYKILHQTDYNIKNAATYKASIRKIADKVDISPQIYDLKEFSSYELIKRIGIKEPEPILDINELLSKHLFRIFLDYFKTIFKEPKEAALLLDNKYLSEIFFDILILGYDSEYINSENEMLAFKYANFNYELEKDRAKKMIDSRKMINNSFTFDKINAKEMVLNFLDWYSYDFEE